MSEQEKILQEYIQASIKLTEAQKRMCEDNVFNTSLVVSESVSPFLEKLKRSFQENPSTITNQYIDAFELNKKRMEERILTDQASMRNFTISLENLKALLEKISIESSPLDLLGGSILSSAKKDDPGFN